MVQCLDERKAKEAALISMQDYEQAAEAQHKEWAADVARLQEQLAQMRRQNLERARSGGANAPTTPE